MTTSFKMVSAALTTVLLAYYYFMVKHDLKNRKGRSDKGSEIIEALVNKGDPPASEKRLEDELDEKPIAVTSPIAADATPHMQTPAEKKISDAQDDMDELATSFSNGMTADGYMASLINDSPPLCVRVEEKPAVKF